MRILYCSDNTSVHNRRFLRTLAESNLEVWFCDVSHPTLPANWLPSGVQPCFLTKTLPSNPDPAAMVELVPELTKMLEALKPDLVHAGPVQTCGYPIALTGWHPILLTSWGADLLVFPGRSENWREATKTAIEAADALFVDSESVLQAAQRFAKIPEDRVVIFPWGIEAGQFSPEGPCPSKQEFQSESETCVILCTRSWEPLYGIETLMKGFQAAHIRDRSLRLLLIGGGSEAPYIYNFIHEHDLKDAVKIPGQMEARQLPQWFRVANGYISCAKSDGTSISLLEAMATGLPVIVTDIPSNREWVKPGVNGWLANDEATFADAMLCVSKLGEGERATISAINRSIVSARADWDRNFPRLLAMYEYLGRNSKGIIEASTRSRHI